MKARNVHLPVSSALSLENIWLVQEHNPIRGLWGAGGKEATEDGKVGIMKLDAALGRRKSVRFVEDRDRE